MVEENDQINMKLVIIGDGGVGKTCLLLTYINKGFPRQYSPTVVDNYQARVKVGPHSVCLDIWDTAGQEDFENIRNLSYPGTNCVIACYNSVKRSSFENISGLWLPEMKRTIPDTPFVLVGTKADLIPTMKGHAILEEEAAKLCKKLNGYHSLQCSAIQYMDKSKSRVRLVFNTAITCVLDNMNKKPSRFCTLL